MRTIKQTMEYLKEKDSDTALTEWNLRNLLKSGKLKSHRAGNKYLINLDYLEEYLNNPEQAETDAYNNGYGNLRQVK